jgi:hypothetical protein
VDHWRHFEPWLEPLKVALGSVLPAYPAVPAELTSGFAPPGCESAGSTINTGSDP